MRREAAQLIPCNNIVRRSGDELLQTGSRKRVMCDIPEADFVAVAKKTDTCGESCLDRAKRFVTARRGDAVSFAEQFAFQQISAASPLGNFQAGAELRFGVVKRMGEHARQKCLSRGALHKLRRSAEQAEHNAHQRRIRKRTTREMNQQLGSTHCGSPVGPLLLLVRLESFEALPMTKFLNQEGVEILVCECREQIIQAAR